MSRRSLIKGILGFFIVQSIYSWMPNSALALERPSKSLCRALFIDTPAIRIDKTASAKSLSESLRPWNKNNLSQLGLGVESFFLPAEFQQKVEQEQGPITGLIEVFSPDSLMPKGLIERFTHAHTLRTLEHIMTIGDKSNHGFRITLSTRESPSFVKIVGVFDRNQPNKIHFRDLRLSNPLAKEGSPLHLNQNDKGLPYPVFKYLKDSLFEFLRMGNINTIVMEGAQNYTVSVLYRRFVGFAPNSTASKTNFEYLDYLFSFAKKLPPHLAPKNVDEFSRTLGSFDKPSKRFLAVEEMWGSVISKSEKSPLGLNPIYNQEGKPIAVSFESADGQRPEMYFINPDNPYHLIHWSRYKGLHSLELKLEAPKAP